MLKKDVAEIIAQALKDRGWSAAKLAREAGVAPSTITRALDMSVKFIPSTRTMNRILAVIHDVDPSELLPTDRPNIGAQPVRRRIPIAGEIRAGAWIEIPDEPTETDWVYYDDPEYRNVRVYALKVVGSSMDRIYPGGTTVIVADAIDTNVFEGDVVVVRRKRGPAVETTLKEVMIDGPQRISLWPRSNDPLFQEPFRIDRTTEDIDEGPEIIGIVIASYNKRARTSARMVEFGPVAEAWETDERG